MNVSATEPEPRRPEITILSKAALPARAIDALRGICEIETALIIEPSDASLADRRATLNRSLLGCRADWVLLLREDESISEPLGSSIARMVREAQPRAWGARVARELWYSGRPIRIATTAGEIRLFHKLHGRLEEAQPLPRVRLQGTVVRFEDPLTATLYASREEHLQSLRERGVPQSLIRRVQIFVIRFVRLRAWSGGAAAVRFLWTDSAFDLGRESAELLDP